MPFGAILLIVVFAAAGQVNAAGASAPATSHTGAALNACSLLTKEDAAEALGEPVHGPDGRALGEVSSCEYSGSGIHRLNLNLRRFSQGEAQMYAGLCAQKGKQGLTSVGNVTCWYNEKHEELQVLKGTQFFSIELRRGGDPTEAIKRLAKQVYDKLP